MSAAHTPKVLDIIRTAAADCDVQGNTMARNELLDAAAMVRELLDMLREAQGRAYNPFEPTNQSAHYWRMTEAIAKATGAAS